MTSRRVILCNQLCSITVFVALLYELFLISINIHTLIVIHTGCICGYVSVPALNKAKKFQSGKNVFLITAGLEIFIVSLLMGTQTGIFFYYFPLLCAACILYDYKELSKAFPVIAASVVFVILLHMPGDWNEQFEVISVSKQLKGYLFISSLACAICLTLVCMFHVIRANFRVEMELEEALDNHKGLNLELAIREEELTENLNHLSVLTSELQSRQARLSAIVESSNHLIWLVDRTYHLIHCNSRQSSAYFTRFGCRLQPGDHFLDPMPEETATLWQGWYDKALSGKKFSVEKQRETACWEIFFNPVIEETGQVTGVTVFMQDISARKEAEREMLAAREAAEKASLAKAQFLSTMSHEIRTPMNAVIGASHLLLQQQPRPDQMELLEMLHFSSENLLSLINDILDLHKIEAGKVELEEVDFQPADLFRNIVQSMKLKAGEKRIGLRSEIDRRLPAVLKGDPVRLTQVLTNLVSNAVKFTSEGEVVVEISVADENAASALLRISVTDTGIGIPEDKQSAIFDAFEQASQDTTRRYGGTGLGLTITKRLLELQGSQIMLESKPGAGSRFFFSIRLKKGHLRTGSHTGSDAALSPGDLGHLRLLLVEDNPINVLLARKCLEKWNLTPDHASDGQVAVYMVQQNQYDLVLMDLQMPVMDGFEATRQIRGLGEAYRYLPVVALTADTVADVREKATAAGMTDFLTKPYNPAELYKILERYSRVESRPVLQPAGVQVGVLAAGNHKPPVRLQKIQELADGDEIFAGKMIRSCKDGLSDLHFHVEQAVRQKDGLLLNSIIHKAKPMISLLDLTDLLQLLRQTSAMLADPQAEQALEENLTQVQECCRQAAYELSEMLTEE